MIVEANSNVVLLNYIHGSYPVITRLIISLMLREKTDVDATWHSSRITRINAPMN
jgi:hypothetical protein